MLFNGSMGQCIAQIYISDLQHNRNTGLNFYVDESLNSIVLQSWRQAEIFEDWMMNIFGYCLMTCHSGHLLYLDLVIRESPFSLPFKSFVLAQVCSPRTNTCCIYILCMVVCVFGICLHPQVHTRLDQLKADGTDVDMDGSASTVASYTPPNVMPETPPPVRYSWTPTKRQRDSD